MKTNKISILGTTFVLIAGILYTTGLQGADAVSINTNLKANISTSASASSTGASTSTSSTVSSSSNASSGASSTRGNATSSASVNKNVDKRATTTVDDDNSDNDNNNGQSSSEAHRSSVATFVKSLLGVADREGGIGAQVSAVAKSQNESGSTTVHAMQKVEGRGSIRTFLFGDDYKSIGVIRSEMATTTKNIAKLQALLEQTTNDADRMTITAQIEVLRTEQLKLEAFIKAHESSFSLFGWFTRWF